MHACGLNIEGERKPNLQSHPTHCNIKLLCIAIKSFGEDKLPCPRGFLSFLAWGFEDDVERLKKKLSADKRQAHDHRIRFSLEKIS